jgi:hypothetical protein
VKQAMREPENTHRPDGNDLCSPEEPASVSLNRINLLNSIEQSNIASLHHRPKVNDYLRAISTLNQQTDANLQAFGRNPEIKRLAILNAYAKRSEENQTALMVDSLLQNRSFVDKQIDLRNLMTLRYLNSSTNLSSDLFQRTSVDRLLAERVRAQQSLGVSSQIALLTQSNLRPNDGQQQMSFPANEYVQLLHSRHQLSSSIDNSYEELIKSLLVQQNSEGMHRPSMNDSNLTDLIPRSPLGMQSLPASN